MLAFRAQKKAIQSAVLSHRWEAIETASEHFVHVTLMTHVHDKPIARRVENAVQRDGQLDDAQIRPEMPAGLGKDFDQFVAHLLRQLRQILFAQRFYISGRMDPFEQPRWRRSFRKV